MIEGRNRLLLLLKTIAHTLENLSFHVFFNILFYIFESPYTLVKINKRNTRLYLLYVQLLTLAWEYYRRERMEGLIHVTL